MLAAALALGYSLGGSFVGVKTSPSGHQRHVNIALIQTGGYKYAATDNDTHDAFTPSDFAVYSGQTVNLTIVNYYNMPHSLTSTTLGGNFNVPGNTKDGVPAIVHYQFKVDKPSAHRWWYAVPCDQASGDVDWKGRKRGAAGLHERIRKGPGLSQRYCALYHNVLPFLAPGAMAFGSVTAVSNTSPTLRVRDSLAGLVTGPE